MTECVQTVEDIFKVTLSSVMTDTSSGKNAAMPDLIAVRLVTDLFHPVIVNLDRKDITDITMMNVSLSY